VKKGGFPERIDEEGDITGLEGSRALMFSDGSSSARVCVVGFDSHPGRNSLGLSVTFFNVSLRNFSSHIACNAWGEPVAVHQFRLLVRVSKGRRLKETLSANNVCLHRKEGLARSRR